MEEVKSAQITVFLSLMLTILLSLVCTIVESARVQGAIIQAQSVSDLGIYSLFGEYNKDMLETYDLFFIDGGYGEEEFSNDRIDAILKEYMEENCDISADYPLLDSTDLWRVSPVGVDGNNYVLASNGSGEVLYREAVRYMKDAYGISLAESLLETLSDSDGIEENNNTYEEMEQESNSDISQINAEKSSYDAA